MVSLCCNKTLFLQHKLTDSVQQNCIILQYLIIQYILTCTLQIIEPRNSKEQNLFCQNMFPRPEYDIAICTI